MQDFEKLGVFYLGRTTLSGEPLLYESKDLVTHAVCVGMTGSGKTGLCIALLEEAAIDGIPAIVIDPKGDLSNLLLQFPEFRAADFEPWVNEEDAKRKGLPIADYAAAQAETWRKGLAEWAQDGERIRRLQQSAEFTVYTPGSGAGQPLSVLKSFAAPGAGAAEDRELVRDRISGTVSALLSLLSIDAEPMKSREHILISTLLDCCWKDGKSLDLSGLIHQIQHPPVTRIGVMDIESFYPAKERFDLAMALNNLLASPGFEAWMEGEALDIGRLLHTAEGKPRISILSISHLSDSERMFFVSVLLNEVLGWTRQQSGTTSLRAILYMDEIFGYFPPVANPPSKRPLLTMLKQARAFGVGVVLATQNPVDIDYKGLSNAGTWFIGRLQTERDKARLIEGLEGVSAESGKKFDRGVMEQTLAGLGNRVFLLNNVHEDAPVVFQTRWAMSYLRGPLTRAQIRMLAKPPSAAAQPSTSPAPAAVPVAPALRVSLPPGVPQKFIPLRGEPAGVVYKPMLLAAVQVHYTDTKLAIDQIDDAVYLTPIHDEALPVEWKEAVRVAVEPDDLESAPPAGAAFGELPPAAGVVRNYAAWSKDLTNWVYAMQRLDIFRCSAAKLTSRPGETEGDFRVRAELAHREKRDEAIEKIRRKYAPKIAGAQEKLRRAQQTFEREQEQSRQQNFNTALSVGASLVGALFGRKLASAANAGRAATAARSMTRSQKESQDIRRASETVEAVQQQLADLDAQLKADIDLLELKTDPATELLEKISIKPKKANISVRLLTLAWTPYRATEPAF